MIAVDRWRCFVACELNPALREALSPATLALAALGRVVRGSPIDGIHLTLHFLGSIAVTRVDALVIAMAPVATAAAPFTVEVGGVNAFPGRRKPQVLFATIGGAGLDPLRNLHAALARSIVGVGLELEERAFRPHLTLGRVRPPVSPPDRQALTAFIEQWSTASFGDFPIDAVHLIRSQLGTGPPRYTTVQRFPLGGSEVRPGGFEPPHPGP